ncbi:MAG: FAD-dependent oxidoreductase [Lachnospiraceae bacterium]|nr:FAD-dependent oxidoreductase [Lachnospiraceae bacterium]
MDTKSIWQMTEGLPHFAPLKGNAKTDVLIIGGGMAGILCAHFLKERGVDYMLVEKDTIGSHTTGNTTAKITAQHGLIYQKLLGTVGVERARQYLEANQEAVGKYFKLCEGIDCDFSEKDNYVYSVGNRGKIEAEARAIEKLGGRALLSGAKELPVKTVGAVGFAHQAQFHPLKFIRALAGDLNIFEHTFVKGFLGKTAVTKNGKIAFCRLVVATHFPMDNKHGLYFMKLYQHRSYVLALADVKAPQAMYVDEEKTGFSFRGYGDFLLLGGGGHRTGKQGGAWQELRRFSRRHYPQSREVAHWAAQDCMPLDGIPYIGKYSRNMADCYVATGFGKWGMTSSMAGAMLLADMLTGRRNPYADVFAPSRGMLHPQLFVNTVETLGNFLIPSGRRCPHLGCVLKWNKAEHSWDCPCHGSRFSGDGRLLDGPANGGIPQKKVLKYF